MILIALNPVSEETWLFSNRLLCLSNSYGVIITSAKVWYYSKEVSNKYKWEDEAAETAGITRSN